MLNLLKSNTAVLKEIGVPDELWNYDGHGGPSEFRFFELSGDGDMLVLRSIAYEIAVGLRKMLGEPYRVLPEPLREKNGERAYDYCALVKSVETAGSTDFAGIRYGAEPGNWCLLLDVTGCLYIVDERGGMVKDKAANLAFDYIGDDECPIPVPAYDRFDWLTEDGLEAKSRLESAGWTVRLSVSNGEHGDVDEFGY